MTKLLIAAGVTVLVIAAGAGLVLGLTAGGGNDSWRDNCVTSRRLLGPDEPRKDTTTGAKWVCGKQDGTSTVVITYADALGISAEEQKDMSLNLARRQGFGGDVVDDGPTWIEVQVPESAIPVDPCTADPVPPECQE